jgi:pimeloyl-ACP methyl ester carboxylesterase
MSSPDLRDADIHGRRIAYRLREGAAPTLVFLPGYGSDMEGAKALALDAFAERRGLGMLRFDYSGTGSSGGEFEQGTLALWLEEALAVVDRLSDGPVVLVGSSMGGWIALHLALLRPDRVKALVGIAAAADFTDWGFSESLREVIREHGRLGDPRPGGPPVMTREFWTSGQDLLLLGSDIAVHCPVRLLHGDADTEVPLDVAFRTMARLRSADVQLMVLKGGGHRLSEPREIDAILRTVAALAEAKP